MRPKRSTDGNGQISEFSIAVVEHLATFMEYAQTAGMLFLLALLIYANFNDLYRFVLK